jgi:hypothetical protein
MRWRSCAGRSSEAARTPRERCLWGNAAICRSCAWPQPRDSRNTTTGQFRKSGVRWARITAPRNCSRIETCWVLGAVMPRSHDAQVPVSIPRRMVARFTSKTETNRVNERIIKEPTPTQMASQVGSIPLGVAIQMAFGARITAANLGTRVDKTTREE